MKRDIEELARQFRALADRMEVGDRVECDANIRIHPVIKKDDLMELERALQSGYTMEVGAPIEIHIKVDTHNSST